MEQKTDKRGRRIRQEIAVTGVREAIGKRMAESLAQAPHGNVSTRFDMSRVVAFREALKAEGRKVSFTDIFIMAVAAAAKAVPIINSTMEGKTITVYDTINVGVAVQVGDILVVPVVNGVESKNLAEVSRDSREMIEYARSGQFAKMYMDGGTITVNNLGMFHIDSCFPILNTPETAIVGFGKIAQEPWVTPDGNIEARPVATISTSINHAVVDGGQVGEFMGELNKIFLSPEQHIQ